MERQMLSVSPVGQLVILIIIQAFRYIAFAGIAYLICYSWKRKAWIHRKIQPSFPSHKDLYREIGYSLSTACIFGIIALAMLYATRQGYTQMYYSIASYGWGYWFLSLLALIFIHDTWFYWSHRWMHSHHKIFRLFHRIHHLSHNPSPWAAFAFHPLEALVEALFLPLVILVLPVHTSVLFLFLFWMIVLNVLGHTGYEFNGKNFTKHPIFQWINTPTHHNMHHKNGKGNYSLYFNFWDKIMHTNHQAYQQTYERVQQHIKA